MGLPLEFEILYLENPVFELHLICLISPISDLEVKFAWLKLSRYQVLINDIDHPNLLFNWERNTPKRGITLTNPVFCRTPGLMSAFPQKSVTSGGT